jgi:hypothetical protein
VILSPSAYKYREAEKKQGGEKEGDNLERRKQSTIKNTEGMNKKKQKELGNCLWETGRNKVEFFREKKIKENKNKQRGDEGEIVVETR